MRNVNKSIRKFTVGLELGVSVLVSGDLVSSTLH